MYFNITNNNFSERYPNVQPILDIITFHDKTTGYDYSAVNIKTINDLLTLDSLARSTEENYQGFCINGNNITFIQ